MFSEGIQGLGLRSYIARLYKPLCSKDPLFYDPRAKGHKDIVLAFLLVPATRTVLLYTSARRVLWTG
ncbi:hypothetical protein WAI453_009873 [Rhynchosporium graminicola]